MTDQDRNDKKKDGENQLVFYYFMYCVYRAQIYRSFRAGAGFFKK
ncbi:hypothetical protein P7H16_02760 [Paenibacillus larvae]|nr:hypothetical protein [Paenibacillus larvae]MDT2239503.1 hypothetical protein [Paenibacillus larvae]MDT2246146.1 hypothetical protein [Paenibacillus larvae]MDT2259481.1 hypothetical protein [Paenibacillus larvae]MDT2263550.1 hypothetical protein [Paenibacillus larvae]MDT2286126.1 hypothetical protein [Paenibacillus larvae]